MKILVVGSGGREHALVWRLAQSGHEVIASPGNPGMAEIARCVAGEPVEVAKAEHVDLVVVGPEAPLVAGLADRLRAEGVATFGPGADGARLEGSKAFSKDFFARHGIPSAKFFTCHTVEEADAAADDLLLDHDGREVSVLALTDGHRLEVLPAVEDHKTIFDGDRGPNTGGMGTVSPAWTAADRVRGEILEPTVRGLRADGIDYRGVLYAGVMIDRGGAPWLLEYNCRFGDPETQPIMARLRGDLGAVLLGCARGEMPEGALDWDPRACVCVVVAAAGYPDTPRTGDPIQLASGDDVVIFHAGTAIKDGQLVTAGGRVLGVTALGGTVEAARARAYDVVDRIALPGKQVRRDIGVRG